MRAHELNAIERIGRIVALFGVVLPLLMIGGLKFTAIEVAALEPMMAGVPWLAWMVPVFGAVGTSRLLGVVEITAALLLLASVRIPWAGVAGGAIGALTFLVTCSLFFALPVWEAASGGFPALSGLGSFLIKDVALLGISMVVCGESLSRTRSGLVAMLPHRTHSLLTTEGETPRAE